MSDKIAIEQMIDGEGREITHRTYPNATNDQANRTRTLGIPSDFAITAIVRGKTSQRQSGGLVYHDSRSVLMKAKDGPPSLDDEFIIDGETEKIGDFTKMQDSGEILAYRVELQ